MPHQPLDGVDVHSGFQQVGGEGMPQAVDAAVLADAGAALGRVEDLLRRGDADGLVELAGGAKQPRLGPLRRPVATQLAQQARGQQRVAILGTLALLHPDGHARRVDVAHLQMAQLRDPQPRPVGGHQHGAVLGIDGALDQARDLFARQDLGQLLRLARAGDLELRLGMLERDVVAELQ